MVLPRELSEVRESEGMLSELCSAITRLAMSITRTPSLGRTGAELLTDEAEVAKEPIIIKKKIAFTMPHTNRPHSTASTHLTNSLVFIFPVVCRHVSR